MNLHTVAAYALHLLTSRRTTGHGVHSPLMFSFITGVIGGRTSKHITDEVRSLRREMLSDRRVVIVTDLGAGSSVMRGRERSVRHNDTKRGAKQSISRDASMRAGDMTIQQNDSVQGRERSINEDASMRKVERSIRHIASAAAIPQREAALLARIAASLDSIMERASGQQAGYRVAEDQNISGNRAEKIQSTNHKVNDSLTDDLPENIPGTVSRHPGWRSEASQKAGSDAGTGNQPVILELGTSLGISTLALALGAPHRKVITVEGCPVLAAIASENLSRHGAVNAEVLNMEFSQALSYLKDRGTKIDMAFIDGNHRGGALKGYVHQIWEMADEVIIVADDIHLNRDMILAWKSLYRGQHTRCPAGVTGAHPGQRQVACLHGIQSLRMPTDSASEAMSRVSSPATTSHGTASLETFRLGILFCLHHLTPGHYRILY